MHSLRRSIRQSFRQRSNTTAVNDRRKVAESLNLEAEHLSYNKQSVKKIRPRASSEPASPVTNATSTPISNDSKARFYFSPPIKVIYTVLLSPQVSAELSGLVSHLSFSDTHVSGGGAIPAIFAATMGSSVVRYSLTLPAPSKRLTQLNRAFNAGLHQLFVFHI